MIDIRIQIVEKMARLAEVDKILKEKLDPETYSLAVEASELSCDILLLSS